MSLDEREGTLAVSKFMLDGKGGVNTGRASGIGRSTAIKLGDPGAGVVVADIRQESRECRSPGHEHATGEIGRASGFFRCDIASMAEAVAEAAIDLGDLDMGVNHAGSFADEEFAKSTEEHHDRIMNVNVKKTYFGSQVGVGRMLEAENGGSNIHLSSVAGIRGAGDFSTYCTPKGAIGLMTYSLAANYGPAGIGVDSIHPGSITASMHPEDISTIGGAGEEGYLQSVPFRRFGQPEDVASATVNLASEASSYVNGEPLVVDGGYSSS